MYLFKFIVFFSFCSCSFFQNHLKARACDVALLDWSPEYHCISKLKLEGEFQKIPFHGPQSSQYLNTISRIKSTISKLPKECREDLPDDYIYGPFLALSKYKKKNLLITSIREISTKLKNHFRSQNCTRVKTLSLIGHGREGYISLGAGIEYDENGEISNENKNLWKGIFKQLSGKVERTQLVGCKTGRGEEGHKLVKSFSQILGCEVTAPTKGVSSSQDIFHLSKRERTTYGF